MPDLAGLHALWRYSHIAVGVLGLIVFWIPVFAKKGSPLHIRCGRLFVYCGYWVVATALLSCAFVFVDPITFQTMRGGTTEEAARHVNDLQFLFGILGFLAINVLGGLRMGVRLVQTKKNPELLATVGLRTLMALGGVVGAALIAYGLWHMRTAGLGSRYVVSVVVGFLGVFDCISKFRFFANPRPTPMAWWYKHMECMLACGIGFHTAFLVFGAGRLIPAEWLPGALRLVPWILPR